MGFLGSYLLGLDPSKIPPWGVARSEGVADAAVEAAVTVLVTTDAIEVMIAGGELGGTTNHAGCQAGWRLERD
jgi:hypothetical protein